MKAVSSKLLGPDEVPPVLEQCADGASPFVFTCDHYGRLVPRALGDLGVGKDDWERHIAWDIGIGGVTTRAVAGARRAHDRATRIRGSSSTATARRASRHRSPCSARLTAIPGNEGLSDGCQGGAARRDFSAVSRPAGSDPRPARAREARRPFWWRCIRSRRCMRAWRGPGTSARSTIATGGWRRSCCRCCMRRAISSSATTSLMRRAMRPTIASRCMRSRAG